MQSQAEHAQQTCSQMLEKADYLAATLAADQVYRLRYVPTLCVLCGRGCLLLAATRYSAKASSIQHTSVLARARVVRTLIPLLKRSGGGCEVRANTHA